MEFNIGERVRVKTYEEMPEEAKNKGIEKVAGKEGEIVDKIYSEARECTIYKIHLDGYSIPSRGNFTADCLDLVVEEDEQRYVYEIEHFENLVVARLYEVVDGEKVEIAKGHGHIFHDGAYGVAQAASYALKRIAMDLNDGTLKEYEK